MIAERKNKLNTSTNTHRHRHTRRQQTNRTPKPTEPTQTQPADNRQLFHFKITHTRTHIHTYRHWGNVCSSSSSSSSFSRVRTHNFPLLMIQIVYWISSCCGPHCAALLSFIFIYISRFVSFYVYGLFRKQFAAAPTPRSRCPALPWPALSRERKVDSTELLICLCSTRTPSSSASLCRSACVRVLCV